MALALLILKKRAEDLFGQDPDLWAFGVRLLKYIDRTWMNRIYKWVSHI